MDRYAVVDQDGIVINVIMMDEGENWSPPEECTIVKIEGTPGSDLAQPRARWDGTQFTYSEQEAAAFEQQLLSSFQ